MGTQQVGSLLNSDDSEAGVLTCECEFPPWPQSPYPVTTPWHLPGGLLALRLEEDPSRWQDSMLDQLASHWQQGYPP